jgi:hypothetical protein
VRVNTLVCFRARDAVAQSGGVDIPVCHGLAIHVLEFEDNLGLDSDSDPDSDDKSIQEESRFFALDRNLQATLLQPPALRVETHPNPGTYPFPN